MIQYFLLLLVFPQIVFAGYEDGTPEESLEVRQPPNPATPRQNPGPPAGKPPPSAQPPATRPLPVQPQVVRPAPSPLTPVQPPVSNPAPAVQPPVVRPAPTQPAPVRPPPSNPAPPSASPVVRPAPPPTPPVRPPVTNPAPAVQPPVVRPAPTRPAPVRPPLSNPAPPSVPPSVRPAPPPTPPVRPPVTNPAPAVQPPVVRPAPTQPAPVRPPLSNPAPPSVPPSIRPVPPPTPPVRPPVTNPAPAVQPPAVRPAPSQPSPVGNPAPSAQPPAVQPPPTQSPPVRPSVSSPAPPSVRPAPTQLPPVVPTSNGQSPVVSAPIQPPMGNGTMPDGIGQAPPSNPAFEACIQSNPTVFCEQIIWWDKNSREQDAVLLSPPGFVAASPFASTLQAADVFSEPTERNQCLSIQCICQFARGRFSNNQCILPSGQVYGKAYRKELRMMTDDERYRFRNAMWAIRTTQYLTLSRIHSSYVTSPAAHSGPAFLPWHREFIKRLEIALRQYDPTVSLPYWDSTPDARLDDPKGLTSNWTVHARYEAGRPLIVIGGLRGSSVFWDDELMGSTDGRGTVNSGLFAYWQAHLDHTTQRFLGAQPNSRPTTQDSLTAVNQLTAAIQVLAYSAASNSCPRNSFPTRNAVEFIHASNHVWIGGDMRVTTQATNDPVFYMHHCMIDNIWETWRLARQSRSQRQNDYPTDNIYCSSQSHFSRSIMVPFSPMVNIDGLTNDYTDNLYAYAPRPSCSRSNRDCGSRYLFCHGTQFVCVSRIRAPFACDPSRYGGVDPCYGQCVRSRCVAPPRAASGPPVGSAPPQEVPIEQDESCYNQNPCCASWAARGGCEQDRTRMRLVCPASCQACTPRIPIADDCTDRHPLCADFVASGRCTSSSNFMAENCRRSCNLCSTPRSAGCATRRLL